jgi:hypothetical protein
MGSLDQVGAWLAELQIADGQQWQQARQKAGTAATLPAVLAQLAGLPAWWADRGIFVPPSPSTSANKSSAGPRNTASTRRRPACA